MNLFFFLSLSLLIFLQVNDVTSLDLRSELLASLRFEKKLKEHNFKKNGMMDHSKEGAFFIGLKLNFSEADLLATANPEHENFRKFDNFKSSRKIATQGVAKCHRVIESFVKVKKSNVKIKKMTPCGSYISIIGTFAELSKLIGMKFQSFSKEINEKDKVELPGTDKNPLINLPEDVSFCISAFDISSKKKQNASIVKKGKKKKETSNDSATCNMFTPPYVLPDRISPNVLDQMYSIPNISTTTRNSKISQGFFQDATESIYNPNDLSCFQKNYDIPSSKIVKTYGTTSINYPSLTTNCTQTQENFNVACSESNLDSQYLTAMNPYSKTSVLSFVGTDESAFGSGHVAMAYYFATTKDIPDIISISYGTERGFNPVLLHDKIEKINAHHYCTEIGISAKRGITTFIATGDNGATGANIDNEHPKCTHEYKTTTYACPYATMVGATRGFKQGSEVVAESSSGDITSGGGFSSYFTEDDYDLSWQLEATTTYKERANQLTNGLKPAEGYSKNGRGYPDISLAGVYYEIVADGTPYPVSGTSASTPALAGITARIASELGTPLGFINPLIYKYRKNFFDVIEGENSSKEGTGTCYGKVNGTIQGFPALKGWDASTGVGTLGVPNGYEIYKSILAGKNLE